MMDDSQDISELYYDSAISGESYLYCIENGINTVGELSAFDFSDAAEAVYSELSAIKNSTLPELNIEDVEHTDSDGLSGESGHDYSILLKKDVYALALELTLDVRARNILKNIFAICGDNLDSFADFYLSCAEKDLIRLRNCGRKTITIILAERDYILSAYTIKDSDKGNVKAESTASNQYVKTEPVRVEPQEKLSIEQITLLAPVWNSSFDSLSTRARHVLTSCYDGQEWHDVFHKLISPKFSFFTCRNCGKQTAEELSLFVKEMANVFQNLSIEDFDPIQAEETLKKHEYSKLFSLSSDAISYIISVESKINRFPLLLVIQKHIEELEHRDKRILEGLIDIYNYQTLLSRDVLSAELGLTSERLRQLRNVIFRNLKQYIKSVGEHVDVTHYELSSIAKYNDEEGTNFQDNFVYLIVSLCNGNWTIIGDIEDVFFNPYGHQVNLNIVPSHIAKEYDFKRFLRDFDGLYNTKRTVSTEVNLQNFCLKFFKKQVQIALLNDIVHECKKIIFRLYDCTSNGDVIILGSNTYRGLAEIAEEILRRHGKPMTASEFYAKFREEYPDRKCKSETSFISAARLNPKIKPIGRTSTYTLDEWNNGESRSGTIREFCEEFLLQTEERIASLLDIGNYVRQFRSTATDASIQSNLLAEASGKFGLFTKGSIKYIGFKNRDYDSSYIPAVESSIVVRSLSTSRQLFEEFIVTHDRFPFSSGVDADEQEKRLGRFWSNLVSRVNRGVASADELEMFRHIEDNYSDKNIPRNEYKWRETYKSIYALLQLGGRDALEESDQRWCYKYIQKLKNQQLESWQIPLIINLIELYVKG